MGRANGSSPSSLSEEDIVKELENGEEDIAHTFEEDDILDTSNESLIVDDEISIHPRHSPRGPSKVERKCSETQENVNGEREAYKKKEPKNKAPKMTNEQLGKIELRNYKSRKKKKKRFSSCSEGGTSFSENIDECVLNVVSEDVFSLSSIESIKNKYSKMNQKAKASEKGQNLHALLCRAKILDSAGSSEEFSNSSCEDFVSYKHDKSHAEKGTPEAIADNASDNERLNEIPSTLERRCTDNYGTATSCTDTTDSGVEVDHKPQRKRKTLLQEDHNEEDEEIDEDLPLRSLRVRKKKESKWSLREKGAKEEHREDEIEENLIPRCLSTPKKKESHELLGNGDTNDEHINDSIISEVEYNEENGKVSKRDQRARRKKENNWSLRDISTNENCVGIKLSCTEEE